MANFKKIAPTELLDNPFKLIGKDWMLLSSANAGDGDVCGKDYNTMTASWGGVGILWEKPVAFIFVRPQRHTFGFTEENDTMTLSFFGGEYKKEMGFCGKNSGRDCDKMKETGLTPEFAEGTVYIKEAKNVLILRTLAVTEMSPDSFLDKDIEPSCYPNKDYHIVYIAEIVKTLEK